MGIYPFGGKCGVLFLLSSILSHFKSQIYVFKALNMQGSGCCFLIIHPKITTNSGILAMTPLILFVPGEQNPERCS